MHLSWSSLEAEFLDMGFEVTQGTWPLENSHSRKCCHVDIQVIFPSTLEILYWSIIGHNVHPIVEEPIL